MDRDERKILLLEKHLNQTKLAQKIGAPVQTVCDHLAGRRKTPKWQKAIAKVLGKTVNEVFDSYDGN